jgi:hypothetical protein
LTRRECGGKHGSRLGIGNCFKHANYNDAICSEPLPRLQEQSGKQKPCKGCPCRPVVKSSHCGPTKYSSENPEVTFSTFSSLLLPYHEAHWTVFNLCSFPSRFLPSLTPLCSHSLRPPPSINLSPGLDLHPQRLMCKRMRLGNFVKISEDER